MFIGKLFELGGNGNPDPTDSTISIASITRTGDAVILHVAGAAADATGDIEHSPDLATDSWTVILPGVPLNEPINDTDAARTGEPQGFYRVNTP